MPDFKRPEPISTLIQYTGDVETFAAAVTEANLGGAPDILESTVNPGYVVVTSLYLGQSWFLAPGDWYGVVDLAPGISGTLQTVPGSQISAFVPVDT